MARELPIHNGRMTTDLDANGFKIKNLPPGSGFTQAQADWNQADATAPDFIKNKPTIPVVPTLATVATSGSYNDLSDKPSIPAAQVQSDWNEADNTKASFIKNKPTIPDVSGKADASDVVLTPVYSQTPTFSDEWTFSDVSDGITDIQQPVFIPSPGGEPSWRVSFGYAGQTRTSAIYTDEDATNLAFEYADEGLNLHLTATRTRTDIIGYTLGTQADKPIQPQGDYVTKNDMEADLPYPFVPTEVTQGGPQLPASAFPIAYTYNGTSYSGITSSDVELDADVLYGGWNVKHTATLNLLCHYTSAGEFEFLFTGITSLTFNGSSTPPSMEVPNVLTVSPRTVATYTAGTTAAAFTVAVGTGVSGAVRDCVLVVDCTDADAVAPTVTWSSNFHPRGDAEEIAPVAGVRNVFYISEYATGEFVVGGWHEEVA